VILYFVRMRNLDAVKLVYCILKGCGGRCSYTIGTILLIGVREVSRRHFCDMMFVS
jgi:hypothetical protein